MKFTFEIIIKPLSLMFEQHDTSKIAKSIQLRPNAKRVASVK